MQVQAEAQTEAVRLILYSDVAVETQCRKRLREVHEDGRASRQHDAVGMMAHGMAAW